MSSTESKAGGGIGFLGCLFITFLVLKLTHVIEWSWWWITAPLWGPVAITAAIFLAVGIFMLIGVMTAKCKRY